MRRNGNFHHRHRNFGNNQRWSGRRRYDNFPVIPFLGGALIGAALTAPLIASASNSHVVVVEKSNPKITYPNHRISSNYKIRYILENSNTGSNISADSFSQSKVIDWFNQQTKDILRTLYNMNDSNYKLNVYKGSSPDTVYVKIKFAMNTDDISNNTDIIEQMGIDIANPDSERDDPLLIGNEYYYVSGLLE